MNLEHWQVVPIGGPNALNMMDISSRLTTC